MEFDAKKITTLVLCFLLGIVLTAAWLFIYQCKKRHTKSTEKHSPVKCPPSKLGTATVITNILLCLLYVPLSIMGLFGAMLADNPPDHILARGLLFAAIMLSVYIPAFCVASIALSVIFRKKGKTLLSFFIQFAPLLIFTLVFVLLLISNIIATTTV